MTDPITADERRRSRLGQLVLERGLLSEEELQQLLERERAPSRRGARRLGEALVAEGYLGHELLDELLDEQSHRRQHEPLPGKFRVPDRIERRSLEEYLAHARGTGAHEVVFVPGRPPALRRERSLLALGAEAALDAETVEALAARAFTSDDVARARSGETVARGLDVPAGTFRAVLSASSAGLVLACRATSMDPASAASTPLPGEVARLSELAFGLVLVASRSAATRERVLATLVSLSNERGGRHVIEISRRLSFQHATRKSLIAQREVGRHTPSHEAGLRAALREDPDVLVLGDLVDPEAIATALLAAETGHLVLASIPGGDASACLAHLVDVQDAAKRSLVRASLADSFRAIAVVELVPGTAGQRFVVADVVTRTPTTVRLIREERLHQLAGTAGAASGIVSRDDALLRLASREAISVPVALEYATDPARVRLLAVSREQ